MTHPIKIKNPSKFLLLCVSTTSILLIHLDVNICVSSDSIKLNHASSSFVYYSSSLPCPFILGAFYFLLVCGAFWRFLLLKSLWPRFYRPLLSGGSIVLGLHKAVALHLSAKHWFPACPSIMANVPTMWSL